MNWLLWQWMDSAFPTGAYAHSGGVEAWALTRPQGQSLESAFESLLITQARFTLPFVRAAAREPEAFESLHARLDRQLWGQVSSRASLSQGRALVVATRRSFEGSEEARALALRAASFEEKPLHLPVAFGALASCLTDEDEAARLFAFSVLRGAMSAAVRLNLVGPFEAQRRLASLSSMAARVVESEKDRPLEAAASSSPVLDLLQEMQERLATRLFTT